MSGSFLIDTNIFVCSFDSSVPKKQETAQRLIDTALSDGAGLISYQVIQEFINIGLRKFSVPLTLGQAREYFLKVLKPLCRTHSSPFLFLRSLSFQEEYQLQWYDSLIIAAALQAECKTLYSEDLQHGQILDSLQVINPF